MKPFFAILLLSVVSYAVAQTPKAQITTMEPRLPNDEDERAKFSSTLGAFEFEFEIRDPDVSFERRDPSPANYADVFTNATNSYKGDKDRPRKQNVFVHVTRKDTGEPVPFILTESSGGGGFDETVTVQLEVIVPSSPNERSSRIAAAVKASRGTEFVKELGKKDMPTPKEFFDAYEFQESKPGEYIVQVDYVGPSGKVSSKPLPFTIRDKGNLYEKAIRAINSWKPDP